MYQPVDLDGDGDDEFVRKRPVSVSEKARSVVMKSTEGRAIAQVNFAGDLLNLSFRDTNGDGRLEVIVPVVRGDSLFFGIVSTDGRKLPHFFAVEGDPRKEPSGTIEWDPRHALVNFADVAGDGSAEFVALRKPRQGRQSKSPLLQIDPATGETLQRFRPPPSSGPSTSGRSGRTIATEFS